MLKVSVGHSCDPDSASAIEEVIATCLQELGDAPPPQAGILLAAPDYEHSTLLDKLNEALPGLELIGGTSNSELSSQEGFQQDSLVLILFSSDTIKIRAGVGHHVQEDPQAAVKAAVNIATNQLTQPIKLCLTFPDGLKANGSSVVTHLRNTLSESIPIMGGTTGEQFNYEGTYQFFKTQVLSNAVPILLFSGKLKLAFGVSGGWRPIGPKGLVTRASESTVYEIDSQPARQFYSRYFGDLSLDPADLIGLAVFEPDEENFYFRGAQQINDSQATSLTFFGDIPQQSTVQLIEADREDLVESARTLIQDTLPRYPGIKPEALLCFSCASRRLLLGKQAHLEYEMIQSTLSTQLPIAGFYTYGEISPFEQVGKSYFHNYTLVALFLGTE